MSEVNRIIQDLKFCECMFDYILTPDDCGLLLGYIQELQQENQQLKDDNKILRANYENAIKLLKENKKLKSVLDEIKEYLEKESSHYAYEDDYDCFLCEEQIEELLQILDKVEDL